MIQLKRDYTCRHLGTGKRTVKGIILHDTAGNGGPGDVKYLANPSDGRRVSCDFAVTRDGSIYQLNPDLENNWTYHAGRNTHFKGVFDSAVTKSTVGIEITQKADLSLSPLYPKEQINAVADLCVYLCAKFNLEKSDVTTHAKIITDGSRSDPRKFPFADFWKRFDTVGGVDLPHLPHLSQPVTHTVKQGETLFELSNRYQTSVETIKRLNNLNTPSNLIQVGQVLIVKA